MTLADMIARVRFIIDENSQKNFLDADITTAINQSQLKVQKEFVKLGQGYFVTAADLNPNNTPSGTIAGVELYALPSDFLQFVRVERTDTGYPLKPIDINQKIIQGTTNPSMIPNMTNYSFFPIGKYFGINPIPSSVIPIRLWYVYRLAKLALTSDTSEIPEEYHDMICWGAAIDCIIKDEGDASQLQNQWDRYLNELHTTEGNRQIQEPRGVTRIDYDYGF